MKINEEKLRLGQENNRLNEILNNKRYEIEEMKGLVMRVGNELEGKMSVSNLGSTNYNNTLKVDRNKFKSKSVERGNKDLSFKENDIVISNKKFQSFER